MKQSNMSEKGRRSAICHENTIRREGWNDLVCQQCFVWKKRVAVHIKVKVHKKPSRTKA